MCSNLYQSIKLNKREIAEVSVASSTRLSGAEFFIYENEKRKINISSDSLHELR